MDAAITVSWAPRRGLDAPVRRLQWALPLVKEADSIFASGSCIQCSTGTIQHSRWRPLEWFSEGCESMTEHVSGRAGMVELRLARIVGEWAGA